MNDKVIKNRKNRNKITFLVAILFLMATIGFSLYTYYLYTHSIKVHATIVSINNNYVATVKYKVNLVKYEQKVPVGTTRTVGDQVEIIYNINNPNKLVHYENNLNIIGGGLVITMVLLLLSFPTFSKNHKRAKEIKYLKTKCVFVNARITEIFINNKGKKNNGTYPYRLRCKYVNPTNNLEYTFDSEDTFENLEQIINQYQKTTAIVYINPNDLSSYYVDLNSLYPTVELVDPRELMKQKDVNQQV